MDTNVGQVVLVKDLNPDTSYYSPKTGSYPYSLTEFNDKLYFSARDGENGSELWSSDGTPKGTQLVADITPGIDNYGIANGSFPRELVEFNGKLYFSAEDQEIGRELWVSDGTTEGTRLLVEINPSQRNVGTSFAFPASSEPSNFIEFNDQLYFSADDGQSGTELWVTDGTAQGTQLLVDIKLKTDDNINPYSSSPTSFVELKDKLYFSANDGVSGRELWVSDGTTEGTQLLVDINPDANRSYQYDYLNGSNPNSLFEFDEKIYFAADDDEKGSELWVSDGTTEGTQLLVDINPGSNTYRYNYSGNYTYLDFPARSNPSDFIEFEDKLYFAARNNETGRELWISDGTAEGTKLLADVNPGTDNSDPRNFVEFNDKLYFSADDGENGRELWVSDGTTEGTKLVTDLNPGVNNIYGDSYLYNNNSNPRDLTVVGNELFFSADNGETGRDLFKLTIDDLTEETPILIDGTDASDYLLGSDNGEQINAFKGQDRVNSNGGDDTINGGDGDDRLASHSGSNSILGGNGNDSLIGGKDNDKLDGGKGNDTLAGGNGHDIFILRSGDGNDWITDFNLGSDRLGLADGLQFEHLSLVGHNIQAGAEILASLEGINTEHLSSEDFKAI